VVEGLAEGESAAAGSTRSGEHAPRARGHTAHSAPPALRRGDGQRMDSRVHGSTSPWCASAPPRSSTAGAVSERAALVSRACPLRADVRARGGHADALVWLGSTPGLCPSARTFGWPADAPRAAAPPHSRGSTHPPPRRARRTPRPVHTHDADQIDPPRAAAPARSGWTPAALLRMLPRGSAVDAPAAKARVARPGPSPSPSLGFTSSTSRRVACRLPPACPRSSPRCCPHRHGRAPGVAAPNLSTGAHRFAVSPLDPPRATWTRVSGSCDRGRRYDDDVKISGIPGADPPPKRGAVFVSADAKLDRRRRCPYVR